MSIREFYKGRKVLITGHTGFKGSWLCSVLLEFGADICGIGLQPTSKMNLFDQLSLCNKISSHNILDIRNYDEVKKIFESFKPEIVIHLAAQPLVIDSYNYPRYTYDVNVMGTVNICECVRLSKTVVSFVNVTTDKVYENNEVEDYSFTEKDRLNGFDPYSNSKSCSELVTDSYKKSFFNNQRVAVSTCRAGNVIGGGDYSMNRLIPDCIKACRQNEPILIRNPNSIRPFQHVLEPDLMYLKIAAMQTMDFKIACNYNIGPKLEDCVTVEKLCQLFCEIWKEGANYSIIDKTGPHESNFLKLNCDKISKNLNWRPTWSINEAIEKVIEWEKYENKIEITKIQINDFINLSEMYG
ncbi:MAG: CDP-glucose 4,6-dehydratase [Anaerorhabdus sp.]|uniref:CDP-glucose 4,6-dehydratase n=1 Tax=Anaerorhabdus sp. TaxID=1872524 RepID=UPI002FC95C60